MSDFKKWVSLVEQEKPVIMEMDWLEKSPFVKTLQKYRGKWVHFTNGAPNRKNVPAEQLDPTPQLASFQAKYPYNYGRAEAEYKKALQRTQRRNATNNVPKLGVNVNSKYHDPIGVYCYPIDWILNSRKESILRGDQFGMNYPFYYICDIKMNAPRGIILQNATWDTVEVYAKQNGWKDDLDAYKAMTPEEQKKFVGMDYAKMHDPGDFFWHFVDRLVKNGKTTWNKAYKGIQYICDNNGAIIHNNEPSQIVVFDPSIIKILEQGEVGFNPNGINQDKKEHWAPVFMNIMKAVRGELGGEITWKKKVPSLTFTVGKAKFVVAINETYGTSLTVNYFYGRAEGYYSISRKTLDESSMVQIVDQIVNHAKKIAARKTDLLFQPIMSIDEAKDFLVTRVITGHDFDYKVKINNPESPDDVKYARADVEATTKKEVSDVEIGSMAVMYDRKENFELFCLIKINGNTVVNGRTDDITMDNIDAGFDALADKLSESMKHYLKYIGPDKFRNSWKTWNDPAAVKCFGGWLALNCGINLGGRLQERMKDEIAAYHELAAKPRPKRGGGDDPENYEKYYAKTDRERPLPSPLEDFHKEMAYQMQKLAKSAY